MPDLKLDLQKLEEAKATTLKAFEKLNEVMGNTVDNSVDPQMMIDRVMNYMGSLQDQLGYLCDTVRNHVREGHLPAIQGREQMSRAIKNLGLSEEYEAAPKKVVYASNNKRGPIAFIGKDVEI